MLKYNLLHISYAVNKQGACFYITNVYLTLTNLSATRFSYEKTVYCYLGQCSPEKKKTWDKSYSKKGAGLWKLYGLLLEV
jgi:hypothetical protein